MHRILNKEYLDETEDYTPSWGAKIEDDPTPSYCVSKSQTGYYNSCHNPCALDRQGIQD